MREGEPVGVFFFFEIYMVEFGFEFGCSALRTLAIYTQLAHLNKRSQSLTNPANADDQLPNDAPFTAFTTTF